MNAPHARPLLLLALLCLGPGALACANTYQKKVEPTKEQKVELYSTTATFLYEDGDLDRAQEQAVKTLEVDPGHRAMRRMIGWIRLRKAGNEDLLIAERFFRDLLKEGDENENTTLGLAITCERLGKAYDEVSRSIASGTREPENGADPKRSAADVEARARRYWKESISLLEGLLASGEGNTNAMNALQRVHALAGNYDQSLEWSARLLQRTDEELVTWRRMLREKDLTEGEEALFRNNERAAVDLQTDTHIFAATLLFRLERYEEAVPHLDAVVATSPELAQAYSLRGQLRARSHQYQGAIEDFDRYLALSDAPYESPDIKRAFELRSAAERELGKVAPKKDAGVPESRK